jgi:hypothetical protein
VMIMARVMVRLRRNPMPISERMNVARMSSCSSRSSVVVVRKRRRRR